MKELTEYIRIRDENIAQKEAAKAAKLVAGKELQAFHLEQIVSLIFKKFSFFLESFRR